MKYIVILGDGMADFPLEELSGGTPLSVAKKPNIDRLCAHGTLGLVRTVPQGLAPGSDVANLSVMGYPPARFYTGRSPLEALSIGIYLKDDDVAVRCNLVTLSDEPSYEDKTMLDYSAGEISTREAQELISYVEKNLGGDGKNFYAGVSYRHCLVLHGAELGTRLTPPHDISDRVVGAYLPQGRYGAPLTELMKRSYDLLKDHPINRARIAAGKRPANSIWLWGEGTRPRLEAFERQFGLKGAVISAVDLIKGIGIGAKMQVLDVAGATGTYHTDFDAKARRALSALKDGADYVYIHMEAADECGHQGDLEHKILSIELIDQKVVGYLTRELDKMGEEYRMLIMPDHPTPVKLKTHVSDPVPFVLYDSRAVKESGFDRYDEFNAKASGVYFDDCGDLIGRFVKGEGV